MLMVFFLVMVQIDPCWVNIITVFLKQLIQSLSKQYPALVLRALVVLKCNFLHVHKDFLKEHYFK